MSAKATIAMKRCVCGKARKPKRSYCDECLAARSREWRRKNPEKAKQAVLSWQFRNPEKTITNNRKQNLKANHGLSLEEYDELARSQGGKCALCHNINGSKRAPRLFVDHNHATGEIRGLLCSKCNFMIGQCDENPAILRAAICYLERRN